MNEQQLSVPVEAVAPILAEQRNTALDEAAQWKALAIRTMAENKQLTEEVEKLREDAQAVTGAG